LLAGAAQALTLSLIAASAQAAEGASAPAATANGQARSASDSGTNAADAAADGSTLETLVVTGVRNSNITRDVGAGILGTKSALETPFSINAVSADEIKNLQVKDINGVFRNDASVTQVNSGVSQASGAQFRVRGVTVDHLLGYKIDGLAIPYWSIDLPIELFDSIQVVKGATGFMYGFGSPGGVVNFVTKRATEEKTLSVDAGVRSDSLLTVHVDAGGPITDQLGARLNVIQEKGDTFNGGHNDSKAASLNFDYKPVDRLTLSLDGLYMKTRQDDELNTMSVTAAVTHLDPVSGDTPVGALGTWKTNKIYSFTGKVVWNIDDNWKANLGYRITHLDENFPGNNNSIFDNKGDYNLSAFFVRRVFDFKQFQGNITGQVTTGPLTHDLIVGVDQQIIDYYSDANSSPTFALGVLNIYGDVRPSLAGHPASLYNPKLYLFNKQIQNSVFLIDTINWDRWSLLAGGRYTEYRNAVRNTASVVTGLYDEHPFSPTLALSYKLQPQTEAYLSYTEGFENGSQAGVTNVNYPETFPPIKSKQEELGIKTQQSSWNATAALFQIKEGAGYTNPANVFVQDGQVRYRGVEASASWRPLTGLSIGGSARYQISKYLQTTASVVGKDVPGIPRVQAAIFASYFIPQVPNLNLSATLRYQGEGYGNTTNTLKFPSVTTADIGVGYSIAVKDHTVTLRGSVKNVANKKYWNYGALTVQPGDPRTFQFTTEVSF
jgi:iron complex outermembrane recepter protein